ncbi:MAG: S8 family peptidase [Lentimicrobiaceae bacterium]|nr:S8 family peptidase [Lentimicrobiaceae bacterium]
MKQFLKVLSAFGALVLFVWSVQAQDPVRSRLVDPLPLQEKNEKGEDPILGIDKWNAEGRLFLSLYRQYQNQKSKSGELEQRLKDDFGMQQISKAKTIRAYLPVFLEYEGEDVLVQAEALGFEVQTRLEGICTGLIPLDAATQITAIGGVVRISASLKNQLHNDKSRKANKVDRVQESYNSNGLKQAYDGTGVLLGIIDLGFDYTHPTFYSDPANKSTYRVKKVWDQSASGSKPSGYSYGAEYTGTDAILAAAHDQDYGTHATHVAGTAGGSGAGTVYKGMAPGSDLIFVATNMYNSGILDGISYIEKYAAAQNKPCVVNMSLGSNIGPHDGTDAFDLACDKIVRDGFLLVASAGNSGDTKLHYQASTTTNNAASTYLDLDNTQSTYIDCWSSNKKHFVVFVAVMSNSQSVAYATYQSNGTGGRKEIKSGDTVLAVVNADCETYQNNGQPHVLISLEASTAIRQGYDIMVQFQPVNDEAGIHAWLQSGEFDRGNTEYTHSANIAASQSVLSVAAYNTRTTWQISTGETYWYGNPSSVGDENDISSFSSRGPLANGVNKPDIAAPGAGIVSSGNSYNKNNISANSLIANTTLSGKTYPWVLEQGTSMASPAVAGIVALFLQKDPTLNIAKLKKLLSQTATNDSYTGLEARTNPNTTWGYGKVDALAGLLYLEAEDEAEEPEPEPETVVVRIEQRQGGIIEVEYADGKAVESGDEVVKGSMIYMLADAEEGYHFVAWWDGDTEEIREYELTEDVEIYATFEADEKPDPDPEPEPEMAIVRMEQNPGGTITVRHGQEIVKSGDSLPIGSTLILDAEADNDYHFVAWWDGDTKALRGYELKEDVEIYATFEADEKLEVETAIVRMEQNPGGTITVRHGQEIVKSGDSLPIGSTLILDAEADNDYHFVAWWDGDTKALRGYELKEDVTIYADFAKKTGIESEQEEVFRVYPNPTDGYAVIESSVAAKVDVFSPIGAKLLEREIAKGQSCRLDLSREPSGVYYLRFIRKDRVEVFKLVRR